MSSQMLLALLLLPACLLSGCFPYLVPGLDVTAPVDVSDAGDQVHAFRVDGDTSTTFCTMSGFSWWPITSHSLQRLSVKSGVIPTQAKVSLDRGLVWPMFFGPWCAVLHSHKGLRLRLYRPGYHVIEVKPWRLQWRLEWKPAVTLEDRERAVDTLVANYTCSATSDRWVRWTEEELLQRVGLSQEPLEAGDPYQEAVDGIFVVPAVTSDSNKSQSSSGTEPEYHLISGPFPGSHSKAHQEVLLFIAAEYERLAAENGQNDPNPATLQRLRDKARTIRELAAR